MRPIPTNLNNTVRVWLGIIYIKLLDALIITYVYTSSNIFILQGTILTLDYIYGIRKVHKARSTMSPNLFLTLLSIAAATSAFEGWTAQSEDGIYGHHFRHRAPIEHRPIPTRHATQLYTTLAQLRQSLRSSLGLDDYHVWYKCAL